MQSETTNLSQDSNVSQSPISAPVAKTIATRPTIDAVSKELQPGSDPLDFVRKNLERLAKQGIDPAHAVNKPTAESTPPQAASPEEAEPQDPVSETSAQAPSEPSAPQDETSPASEIAEGTSTEGEVPAQSSSLTNNIKNIRKSLNESKAKLQEKEKEVQTLIAERDKYKTGEAYPEKIKELEDKVQALSKYQAIVDLETSPEYQESLVKPLENLNKKLLTIAKEYEIPEDVMEDALTITSQRELNSFLSEHFDAVGAIEVKNLINETKELQERAAAAKESPKEAMQQLIAENEKIRASRVAQQRISVTNRAKNAWAKSLTKIREENKIPELIITGSDTNHDEKVAKPIVTAAAVEYGKIVTKLVEAGLQELPEDLSDAIANMVLLAHASAVSIEQRNEAVRRYDEIDRNTKRENAYARPPLGGSFGTGPIGAPKAAAPTVEQGARNLLEGVLQGYQNKHLATSKK